MVFLGFQSLPLSLIAMQLHLFYIFLSQPVRLFVPAVLGEVFQIGDRIIEIEVDKAFAAKRDRNLPMALSTTKYVDQALMFMYSRIYKE